MTVLTMNDDASLAQVLGLAGVVGLGTLVGFLVASRTNGSPRLLSCCVGGIMGIIPGTVIFEFLPALEITSTTALFTLGAAVGGFVVAAVAISQVQRMLPERYSFEEEAMASFVLAVVMDDVVEGLTLGFASALSIQLLLFSTAALFSKNILEGFAEATVLRWEGKRSGRIWTAGGTAAISVVIAAAATMWLRVGSGVGDTRGPLMFASATGALLYVSVFALARNLEWNTVQRRCALLGFVATGLAAFIVG